MQVHCGHMCYVVAKQERTPYEHQLKSLCSLIFRRSLTKRERVKLERCSCDLQNSDPTTTMHNLASIRHVFSLYAPPFEPKRHEEVHAVAGVLRLRALHRPEGRKVVLAKAPR